MQKTQKGNCRMQCIPSKDILSKHMSRLFWHLSCLSFLGSKTAFSIIFLIFFLCYSVVFFLSLPAFFSIPFLWNAVQSMPWKLIVSLCGELIISFNWIYSLIFFFTRYWHSNYRPHPIFRCESWFSTVIVSFEAEEKFYFNADCRSEVLTELMWLLWLVSSIIYWQ